MASTPSSGEHPKEEEQVPNTEENKRHFLEKVLPELVADGVFGEDVAVVGTDIRPIGGYGENHWMSCTLRVAVEIQDRKRKTARTVRLVAKYQAVDDTVWLDATVSCRNEELMYNQVVPLFQRIWDESSHGDPEPLGLFPRCYRAVAGDSPLVVMDDMGADGFRLSSSAAALDGAHVFLALNRLGRLHAMSYCAKVQRKSDFLSVARELRDPEYGEERRAYQTAFIGRVTGTALRRLAARGEAVIDAATVEHLRRRLRGGREDIPNGAFDIMLSARAAEEPLAVIAHGDFCRNNVMFKYDEATGRPVDVRFFDLQTARYCSPAVDLSFFLFLNTTPSQRAAHWDDFFLAYYDGLSTTLRRLLSGGSSADPTLSPTMDIPSLSSIKADFARHALYGFVICSFFLPMMQGEFGGPKYEDYALVGEIADQYEAGLKMASFFEGMGEAAEDTLADLLLEFVDRGLVGL